MTCACEESAGVVINACGAHMEWFRQRAKKVCEYEAHQDLEIKLEKMKTQIVYQIDRADMLEELLVSAFNKRKQC